MKIVVAFALLFTSGIALVVSDSLSSLPNNRILNGQDAEPHVAPFMIQLPLLLPIFGERHTCGAVLLNSRWVLTAGHCLMFARHIIVVAGQYDLRTIEPWEQRRSVERFYIHEDYCGSRCPNDIGLIYVNQSFELNRFVQPIQLPASGEIPTGIGRLFGWGLTPTYLPQLLQVVDEPILDFAVCQQMRFNMVDETNFCTGPLDGSVAACPGDSGGPLVQFDANGEPIVIGLVSWGAPCRGQPSAPGVNVRVSAFIDWISRFVNNQAF